MLATMSNTGAQIEGSWCRFIDSASIENLSDQKFVCIIMKIERVVGVAIGEKVSPTCVAMGLCLNAERPTVKHEIVEGNS